MKKMRIVNRIFLKKYLEIIAYLLALFSVIIPFIPWKDYIVWQRVVAILAILAILAIVFLVLYFLAKKMSHVALKIKNTKFTIETGNLLSSENDALKVIPFNEYFDTVVDNNIISQNTLHGKFINEFYNHSQIAILDQEIANKLQGQGAVNTSRVVGKKIRYPLGTIVEVSHGYALLSFSKFNSKNEANLTREEFFDCLLSMWKNIKRINSNRAIILPMMGAGILRINNGALSKQEILETIIYSYLISGFNSNNEIKILIDEKSRKDVDLYKLSVQYKA